ncbi:MAG: aldehyde dehydrogenase family protein [Myxococcota bacterium]
MTERAAEPAPSRPDSIRQGTSREELECLNPATGQRLGTVRAQSAEDMKDAVARARHAQRAWRGTSFRTRRKVLQRIGDHILREADALCALMCEDAGKTRENALLGEIWTVSEKLRWTLKHGEKHLRPERVSSGLFPHKRATIEFHPRGVVGVIAPWNFPLQNVLGPVIPALFAGNACIVKISEHVAHSAARIQWIFDEAFDHFGLPRELVQLVLGDGRTGKALIDAHVDLIVFTGSMENGRKVLRSSADTITPVILELGGKDALVVLDDAHLEQAAHGALAGSFIAAGQNCLAAERTLVQRPVYEAFVARVTELASQLRQGDPLDGAGAIDVGALVTPAQLQIVQDLVDDAIEKLEELTCKSPSRSAYWHELGNAYGKAGRHEESLKAYAKAARTRTCRSQALHELAKSFIEAGDEDNAKHALNHLNQLRPDLVADIEPELD